MKNGKHSLLLIPPAPPGSFGDEAILVASINYLLDSGVEDLGIVSHLSPDQENHPTMPIRYIDCSGYFEHKDDANLSQFEGALRHYDASFFFGADMMDGYYSPQTTMRRLYLVKIAVDLQGSAAIIGFSFNKSPVQEVVDLFRSFGSSVRYSLRDRFSKARFEEATSLQGELTADPAFLLEPYTGTDGYESVSRLRRRSVRKGRPVVGINPNYMPSIKSVDVSVESFIQFHVEFICSIVEKLQCSVVLLPHDIRGPENDLAVCRQIYNALPADAQKWACAFEPTRGAAEIKGIAGLLDVCICQRMHAAIACFGQGVPCLCISYQDKFEGLLDHFSMAHLCMTRREAFHSDKLNTKLSELLKRREQTKREITAQLPGIQSLAEKNFALLDQ